jgi:outer membrane beta-barrel protein
MKYLSLILTTVFAFSAAAADLTSEMDALGANRELMKKARAIDPHNRMRVVQNREVDRNFRLELGLNYGMAAGGDPYYDSSLLGGQLDFHITPRWSIGGRYYGITNTMNSEGKHVYDRALARQQAGDNTATVPGLDGARSTMLAVLNWYPIYGKMSIFDAGISQFDLYLLGGGGSVRLISGYTEPVITAGMGAGIWLTQHISTRLEARWEGYKDHPYRGSESSLKRDINETIVTASIGFLL